MHRPVRLLMTLVLFATLAFVVASAVCAPEDAYCRVARLAPGCRASPARR